MVAARGADRGGSVEGGTGRGAGPGRGAGLGSGGRQGREVQTAPNIQSPSGHFIMSMSRWTEPQLKEGPVWGLGVAFPA